MKSWLLKPDGKYERVQVKPGQTLFRAQARFIEMTRDRIKTAEASATTGRFSLSRLASSRKLDEKSGEGRRAVATRARARRSS